MVTDMIYVKRVCGGVSWIGAVLLMTLYTAGVFGRELEATPQVHGYGVKTCAAYLQTCSERDAGEDRGILEYLRYQDWASGMVTGLSLATATDVLQGEEMAAVMRRVRIICEDDPQADFFTATGQLIKQLSGLQ